MAPSPERANSTSPLDSDPAMPSALVMRSGIEAEQVSAGDGRAKRAGGARRMEAARLVAVLGGSADADHHFGAGDKRGQQLTAAEPALLRQCERQP